MLIDPVKTVSIFQRQPNPKQIMAEQVIFEQGQLADYMYGIIAGQVDIVVNGKVVETLNSGETFGVGALIQEAERRYTAIARSEGQLAYVDRERFLFAVQETPMFALLVLQGYSERLIRVERAIAGD